MWSFFIIIIILWIPLLVVFLVIKHIYTIIHEAFKSQKKLNSELKKDETSFIHEWMEYHQYWFYITGNDIDRWKKKIINNIQVSQEISLGRRLCESMPLLVNIFSMFRSSEVLFHIQNPRYNIKNKIVIVENYSGINKIFIKIISTLMLLLWFPLIVCLILIPIMISTNNENGIFILIKILIVCLLICIILVVLFGWTVNINHLYKNFNKQSMESLWFENAFDAFSKDPIESRMIITPSFMDKIESFVAKYNLQKKLRIIFKDDSITLVYKWDIYFFWRNTEWVPLILENFKQECNIAYLSLPDTQLPITHNQ